MTLGCDDDVLEFRLALPPPPLRLVVVKGVEKGAWLQLLCCALSLTLRDLPATVSSAQAPTASEAATAAAVRQVVSALSAFADESLELNVPDGSLSATLAAVASFAPRARAVASSPDAHSLLNDLKAALRRVAPTPAATPAAAPETTAPASASAPLLHFGVTCDGCGAHPLPGPRYKRRASEAPSNLVSSYKAARRCQGRDPVQPVTNSHACSLTKDDYDVCGRCFSAGGPLANDLYRRIDAPTQPQPCPPPPAPVPAPGGWGGHPPHRFGFGVPPPFSGPCPPFGGPPHCGGGWGGGPPPWTRRGCARSGGGWGGWRGGAAAAGWAPPPPASAAPAPSSGAPSAPFGKLDARFVCDETLHDGVVVAPGARLLKSWRLRNTGAAPWPATLRLVRVGGDAIGPAWAEVDAAAGGAPPGAEASVSVDLVAPPESGRYATYFRMEGPEGRFGQRVWALIVVAGAGSAADGGGGAETAVNAAGDGGVKDAQPGDGCAAAAPAPPAFQAASGAPPTAAKAEEHARALLAMGFSDLSLNRVVLARAGDDMSDAVASLVRMGTDDVAEHTDWVMAAAIEPETK